MIKVIIEEYREDNLAVLTKKVTFLNIPIFKCKRSTTNNNIVESLTIINQPKKVKGFI